MSLFCQAIEKADAKELRSTKIEMFSHLNQYDRNSHPTHTLRFTSILCIHQLTVKY